MNERTPTREAVGRWPRLAVLAAWLSARSRGRRATSRGRCVRIILTLGLLVTGLAAWALALVQPWAGHGSAYGQAAAVLDADRIRAVAANLNRFAADEPRPLPAPGRNPFVTVGAEGALAVRPAAVPTIGDLGSPPAAVEPEKPAPATVSAASDIKAVLAAVKALRLEVTLIGPTGQRWAIINGREYREGDFVAGFQVIEIQGDKVKLQQAGMTCLLRMD
jgi:hypothetical protein